ncbi:MAG: GIY-YIG nuclease family protein [Candidatus Peribacteraceae bacterium]|nr:GIY-YIG nuclease family protein [Candidatus Peribacteraceae bacterium]
MERYFVYMLRCMDGTYYVGITNDVEKRVEQHQDGWDPKAYTHRRRPVGLVYSAEFSEVTDAIAFEKQVKGWGREKKETLMRREYEKLPGLSMNSLKKKELRDKQKGVSP